MIGALANDNDAWHSEGERMSFYTMNYLHIKNYKNKTLNFYSK